MLTFGLYSTEGIKFSGKTSENAEYFYAEGHVQGTKATVNFWSLVLTIM